MSSTARKFFIASLIYLLLGLLAQAVGVVDAWLGFNPLAYTAVNATQQLLLLGWLTQLGLALVYERLEIGDYSPRSEAKRDWQRVQADTSAPTDSETPNRKVAVTVFILFNVGLVLVIIGQPGLALFGGNWLGAAAALGGLLQFSAGALFVGQAWRAVRKGP